MIRGLAAIAAILGAAAGLDGEQARQLHPVGIEILAMNGLGLEEQVVEGQVVDCLRRFPGPLARCPVKRPHDCVQVKFRVHATSIFQSFDVSRKETGVEACHDLPTSAGTGSTAELRGRH